jgi:hypothetical protein
MLAYWSDFESPYSREINTAAQAAELIDELKSSVTTPTLVTFRDDPAGLAFGYAVGREKTVLTFQHSNDPPYYVSLGSNDGDVEWFCSATQYSEFLHRNLIDHDDARRALREFFNTRELPSAVKWERL